MLRRPGKEPSGCCQVVAAKKIVAGKRRQEWMSGLEEIKIYVEKTGVMTRVDTRMEKITESDDNS